MAVQACGRSGCLLERSCPRPPGLPPAAGPVREAAPPTLGGSYRGDVRVEALQCPRQIGVAGLANLPLRIRAAWSHARTLGGYQAVCAADTTGRCGGGEAAVRPWCRQARARCKCEGRADDDENRSDHDHCIIAQKIVRKDCARHGHGAAGSRSCAQGAVH